jgi:hypothetical protein
VISAPERSRPFVGRRPHQEVGSSTAGERPATPAPRPVSHRYQADVPGYRALAEGCEGREAGNVSRTTESQARGRSQQWDGSIRVEGTPG